MFIFNVHSSVGLPPRPPHSFLDVWDCAVVEHYVPGDVQRHQVDQALYDGRQDLPAHLKLRGAPALPGDVKMPEG